MANSNIINNSVSNQIEKYQYSTDMVRIYLREIGRIPLLTNEEEICYGKQIQQMMTLHSAKKKLEIELNQEPTIREWADRVQLSQESLLKQLNQRANSKAQNDSG